MKTVVITGASRGFGRALAIQFSAEASVFAIGRDAKALAKTASLATPNRVQPVVLDCCDESAVVGFFASLDSLDVLVNNAGIARLTPFLESTTDELREILEINVVAAYVVMREAARKMAALGGGHIINIASDAAIRGIENMTAYAASKHALLGMTRSAHLDLRAHKVRVTSFNPGPIKTEILGEISNQDSAMPTAELAQLVVHLSQVPPQIGIQEILVTPN